MATDADVPRTTDRDASGEPDDPVAESGDRRSHSDHASVGGSVECTSERSSATTRQSVPPSMQSSSMTTPSLTVMVRSPPTSTWSPVETAFSTTLSTGTTDPSGATDPAGTTKSSATANSSATATRSSTPVPNPHLSNLARIAVLEARIAELEATVARKERDLQHVVDRYEHVLDGRDARREEPLVDVARGADRPGDDAGDPGRDTDESGREPDRSLDGERGLLARIRALLR